MENASKALIIAGSVLLSVLIISALVLMFNQISDFKRSEATSEDIQKIDEYNKKIEGFNRSGLYGSEILSLANLVNDYNERQSDLKGYKAIEFKIEFKEKSDGLEKTYTKSSDLTNDFKKLESEAEKLKNKKYYGKTIESLVGMKDSQIKQVLLEHGEPVANLGKEEIMNYIGEKNPTFTTEKQQYENLKTSIRNIKNRKFQSPVVTYDKQGKIATVSIQEIGI